MELPGITDIVSVLERILVKAISPCLKFLIEVFAWLHFCYKLDKRAPILPYQSYCPWEMTGEQQNHWILSRFYVYGAENLVSSLNFKAKTQMTLTRRKCNETLFSLLLSNCKNYCICVHQTSICFDLEVILLLPIIWLHILVASCFVLSCVSVKCLLFQVLSNSSLPAVPTIGSPQVITVILQLLQNTENLSEIQACLEALHYLIGDVSRFLYLDCFFHSLCPKALQLVTYNKMYIFSAWPKLLPTAIQKILIWHDAFWFWYAIMPLVSSSWDKNARQSSVLIN